MTTPSKSQRGIMAAHLCDLAGVAARTGHTLRAANLARCVDMVINGPDRPYAVYFVALTGADVSHDDARAAVAAVERDEHPADSLMGRVARMRDDAEGEIAARAPIVNEYVRRMGDKVDTLNKVLDTLEGEGRNARTAGGGT